MISLRHHLKRCGCFVPENSEISLSGVTTAQNVGCCSILWRLRPAPSLPLRVANPVFLSFYFHSICMFLVGRHFSIRLGPKTGPLNWTPHRSQYLIAPIPSSLSSFRALQRFMLRPLQAAIWLKSLDASVCTGIILPAAASWQTQCGLQEKQPQKRHRGPEDYCICWIMPAIRSLLKEKYWFK